MANAGNTGSSGKVWRMFIVFIVIGLAAGGVGGGGAQHVGVGGLQALGQVHAGLPAQGVEAGAVHPLAGGAVGFGGVKGNAPGVTHGLAYGVGYVKNGDVRAKAHVDVALHGQGVRLVGGGG